MSPRSAGGRRRSRNTGPDDAATAGELVDAYVELSVVVDEGARALEQMEDAVPNGSERVQEIVRRRAAVRARNEARLAELGNRLAALEEAVKLLYERAAIGVEASDVTAQVNELLRRVTRDLDMLEALTAELGDDHAG